MKIYLISIFNYIYLVYLNNNEIFVNYDLKINT